MAKVPVGPSEAAQLALATIIQQATAQPVGSTDIGTLTDLLVLANHRFTVAYDLPASETYIRLRRQDVVALTKAVNLARNRAGLAQIG